MNLDKCLPDLIGEEEKVNDNWEEINFDRIVLSDLISPRRSEILDWISEWIIWQDYAKNVIADFIIQSLTKIWKNKWTMWNLFFHWPTWVWKTEIVRSISEFLLWKDDWFIKIDCSEYSESHTTRKLFWAPPSYVWYGDVPVFNSKDLNRSYLESLEKWILNPILNNLSSFSIILLDEIEKAHPEVIKSLLWALDQWTIEPTNPSFDRLNLNNTIFIFTSNIWEHWLDIKKGEKKMWFQVDSISKKDNWQKFLSESIKNQFPPEFRWRIDSFVRFDKLNKDEILEIIDLKKSLLENDVKNYYIDYPKININFDDELLEYIFYNYHDETKWVRELERNFNLNIRRKVELLLTIPQFAQKYDNKIWLLDFNFYLKDDKIILSLNENWIKNKKNIVHNIDNIIWTTISDILDSSFDIFKEVEDMNYLKFSELHKYHDISFVDIYSKKFLVNEKKFSLKLEKMYKSYQTIVWINFEYLQKINLSIPIIRKLVWKILNNYIEKSDLSISIELYTYLNLVWIIKPICENKNIDFEKVNKEILLYFATKWN